MCNASLLTCAHVLLTGMGYQAYLNLGGVPRDDPTFNPDLVVDPIPSNTMPYLILISVLGTFMLTQVWVCVRYNSPVLSRDCVMAAKEAANKLYSEC
jgi:hypothetical protein